MAVSMYKYRVSLFAALALFVIALVSWNPQYSVARDGDEVRIPLPKFAQSSKKPWSGKSKYAVVTMLNENDDADPNDDESDGYFRMTRALCYKLKHDPRTRLPEDVPFIILVTPKVEHHKRKRYESFGAQVREIEPVTSDWVHPALPRWGYQLSKLRLWQMVEFEKVLYIDADHMITGPIAPVFNSVNATAVGTNPKESKEDEGPLPDEYLMAALWENPPDHSHTYPPKISDHFNGGFFMLQPNELIFNHYINILGIEGRFDGGFAEQNLLNYAHRPEGNMPWKTIDYKYNVNWGREEDLYHGVRSLHQRLFTTKFDWGFWVDEGLRLTWEKQDSEARGYFFGVGINAYPDEWDIWGPKRKQWETDDKEKKQTIEKKKQEERQNIEKELKEKLEPSIKKSMEEDLRNTLEQELRRRIEKEFEQKVKQNYTK